MLCAAFAFAFVHFAIAIAITFAFVRLRLLLFAPRSLETLNYVKLTKNALHRVNTLF